MALSPPPLPSIDLPESYSRMREPALYCMNVVLYVYYQLLRSTMTTLFFFFFFFSLFFFPPLCSCARERAHRSCNAPRPIPTSEQQGGKKKHLVLPSCASKIKCGEVTCRSRIIMRLVPPQRHIRRRGTNTRGGGGETNHSLSLEQAFWFFFFFRITLSRVKKYPHTRVSVDIRDFEPWWVK